MRAQGFDTSEYDQYNLNEVNTRLLTDQLDMLLQTDAKKVYIKYFLEKGLKKPNVAEIIDDLFNVDTILSPDTDCVVIITRDEMNEPLMIDLKHIWERDHILVIIQSLPRLQFNLLEHTLVPKHRVMSLEEVGIMKIRYNIENDAQLPDISRFDPVAQAIGLRPGQICEIIRPSKTAIESPYYRLCV